MLMVVFWWPFLYSGEGGSHLSCSHCRQFPSVNHKADKHLEVMSTVYLARHIWVFLLTLRYAREHRKTLTKGIHLIFNVRGMFESEHRACVASMTIALHYDCA